MSKKPEPPIIAPEDSELFREAIGPVIVHRHTESRLQKAKPKPRARMFEHDEQQALQQSKRVSALDAELNVQQPLLYQGPKINNRIMRQLKSGGIRVDSEFDLHGMLAIKAERLLKQFLSDVYLRCPDCDGRRFRAELLEVRLVRGPRQLSVADVLDLTPFKARPVAMGGIASAFDEAFT